MKSVLTLFFCSLCLQGSGANASQVEVKLPERMNMSTERLRWPHWIDEKPKLRIDFSLSEKAVRGLTFSGRQNEENYRSGIRPFLGILGIYELSSGFSARFGGELGFLSRQGSIAGLSGKLDANQELYWLNVPLGMEYSLLESRVVSPFIALDLRPGIALEDQSALGNNQAHFIVSAEESVGFSVSAFGDVQLGLRGFLGHSLISEFPTTWLGAGLSVRW